MSEGSEPADLISSQITNLERALKRGDIDQKTYDREIDKLINHYRSRYFEEARNKKPI